MRIRRTQWSFFMALVLLLLLQAVDQAISAVFSSAKRASDGCDIYLAPSKLGGWGVFAARKFQEDEVVEIAPRYVPMKNEFLERNVLNDYIYQFSFQSSHSDESLGTVAFGMIMFYNHGRGSENNIQIVEFGREPDMDFPLSSMLIGFIANRQIRKGEELLSSYGTDDTWFVERGFTLRLDKDDYQPLSRNEIRHRERQYCRKTLAGVGHSTWNNRIVPTYERAETEVPFLRIDSLLPLQDHPNAIAKEAVQAGQILEMAPVLLMLKDHVANTPLAPMAMFWNDFDHEQQEALKQFGESGLLNVKAEPNATTRMQDNMLKHYEELAILPAAGNIGLVRKVGHEQGAYSNCQVEFVPTDEYGNSIKVGSAGLILRLIATEDIHAGEELRLNLPDSSSWHSKLNLVQSLALTGQPVPRHLLDTEDPMDTPHSSDGVEQEL